MVSQKFRVALAGSVSLLAIGASLEQANAAACSSPYVAGDVFASVSSGNVDVFTNTGTLVCTLSTGLSTLTTGSGFDGSGNFYVTTFNGGTVAKFNNSGTLVSNSFFSTGGGDPESVNNVQTGPFSGTSFVGEADGGGKIAQFNTATGALINTFTATTQSRGTDWIDFLNPTTLIYTSEGSNVMSFNVATDSQNANFATGVGTTMFALRTIPNGALAGDVLVANSSDVLLLDASGNVVKTYALPGSTSGIFSLNLDPNGTDFWTGSFTTTNVYEVNIATGAIDEQWSTGSGSNTFYGLAVFGELTTTGVPEPATLAMFGAGIAGLTALRRRRRKAAA